MLGDHRRGARQVDFIFLRQGPKVGGYIGLRAQRTPVGLAQGQQQREGIGHQYDFRQAGAHDRFQLVDGIRVPAFLGDDQHGVIPVVGGLFCGCASVARPGSNPLRNRMFPACWFTW